jgi:hypothetical protein
LDSWVGFGGSKNRPPRRFLEGGDFRLDEDARREALYHNLAKDYFGMGSYMPKVAAVQHPITGKETAVLEHVPGKHIHEGSAADQARHRQTLQKLAETGELEKLGLMNTITNNIDRHAANFVMTPDDKLKLIDHGLSFGDAIPEGIKKIHEQEETNPFRPVYLDDHIKKSVPIHPEAAKWLHSLDPKELENQMRAHGVPETNIEGAVLRLQHLQDKHRMNPDATIHSLTDYDINHGL